MLINAGIYREDNMGEPALAALIQEDIGANRGQPPIGGHGTFSFDLINGTCGVINAIQLRVGFPAFRRHPARHDRYQRCPPESEEVSISHLPADRRGDAPRLG